MKQAVVSCNQIQVAAGNLALSRIKPAKSKRRWLVAFALLFVAAIALWFVFRSKAPRLSTVPGSSISVASEDLVSIPNESVAFIIGPQLKLGSKLNPYPWFDNTELSGGRKHAEEFPRIPPRELSGKLSFTQGERAVAGEGTRFLTEIDPQGKAPFFNGWLRVLGPDGKTYREAQVQSIQSDTQLTLTAPWTNASQPGASADTYHEYNSNWNNDLYVNANYYDLALCLYVLYYRTGNEEFRTAARKVADSWWLSTPVNRGQNRNFEKYGYAPRNAGLGGLMLRAMDERPEMWDWINAYTRYMFDIWLKAHARDPQLYLGVRDGAFCLLYATWLAKVLPDSFPQAANLRAQYLADVESISTQYFERLQQPDGSWVWDDPYYTDADGGTLKNIMQPFMIGMLLHALVEVHRLSNKPEVKQSVQNQIVHACKHLYSGGPFRDTKSGVDDKKWRSYWYFYHGGTTVNPRKYENGGGSPVTTQQSWEIKSERQLLATSLSAFGYAYTLTKDDSILAMGEELFDAAFGDRKDGIRNEADGTAKNYNQNYSSAPRYLVWRLQSTIAPSSPAATSSGSSDSPFTAVDAVSAALDQAVQLSKEANVVPESLDSLKAAIVDAREKYTTQMKGQGDSAVMKEFEGALEQTRIASQALRARDVQTVATRMEWTAARLDRILRALRH